MKPMKPHIRFILICLVPSMLMFCIVMTWIAGQHIVSMLITIALLATLYAAWANDEP